MTVGIGPGRRPVDWMVMMHSELLSKARKAAPIPSERPEILTDAGLACRMSAGPDDDGGKQPPAGTILRRSWAARAPSTRRK